MTGTTCRSALTLASALVVAGLATSACGLAGAGEDLVAGEDGGGIPDSTGGGDSASAGDSGTGGAQGNIDFDEEDGRPGGEGGGDVNGRGGGSGEGGAAGYGGASGEGGGQSEVDCDLVPPQWVQTASVVVDDSNSYASPLLVRELVADPQRDVAALLPVRPHEFLNYYARGLVHAPVDHQGAGLHLAADARPFPAPGAPGASLLELVVTVSASTQAIGAEPLPDVTFLLDTSISMNGESSDRLAGVVRGAAEALQPEQWVAVLGSNRLAPPIRAMQRWADGGDVETVLDAARGLTADADFSTSLAEALTLARAQADQTGRPGVVVAVSDGSTDMDDEVAERVFREGGASPPVRVVGIGVGPARGYADDVFDQLTDRSGGAYWYAPDQATAEVEVAERFEELTRVAARDVSLRLHLPEGVSVAAIGGGPGMSGEVLAAGQNLGHEGTMTFHVVLEAAQPSATCAAIGLDVRWTGPDDAPHSLFGEGDPALLPLEMAFEADRAQAIGFERVSAVAVAAEALRGVRSAGRLERAAERLRAAVARSGEGDASLEALCEQVTTLCHETGGATCGACAP